MEGMEGTEGAEEGIAKGPLFFVGTPAQATAR